MISEFELTMSVIIKTKSSYPFAVIEALIAALISERRSKTSGISTVLTCAIRTFEPFNSKVFASISINSSAVLVDKFVPALSIASPYSSRLTPAISASSLATLWSVT